MKKSIIIVCLMAVFLFVAVPVSAQEADLKVLESAVCTSVIDRTPINSGTSFPVSVGRLFFFTKIASTSPPATIAHVWYYKDKERTRIELTVGAKTWRTYSYKNIQSHEIGKWRVDVVDSNNNLVSRQEFEITAE